jgi:hypothetical protein
MWPWAPAYAGVTREKERWQAEKDRSYKRKFFLKIIENFNYKNKFLLFFNPLALLCLKKSLYF